MGITVNFRIFLELIVNVVVAFVNECDQKIATDVQLADNWHTNQLHKVHEIGKVIRNWLIDAQATISITIAVLSSLVCIGSVFVRNKLCSFKIMSPDLMFSNTQTNANRSTRVHYVCCYRICLFYSL